MQEGVLGEPVTDLRLRLANLGFDSSEDPPCSFGHATRAAVEAFQRHRGLRIDGICGPQTWGTLVEAGFRLGDRVLYRRSPMMRGDDVAELQQRLSALGFDTGRVDGIFGPKTVDAVAEFQQNAGIVADGTVGPVTLVELLRLQARHRHPELVSTVRANEVLRATPRTLLGRHIALGDPGGIATTVAAMRRRLVSLGARITALPHPDESVRARQANAAGADVYIGFRLNVDEAGCATGYFAGYRNESPGGRRLATHIQETVPVALGLPNRGSQGLSVPILRETAMPAVVIEIGPARVLVEGHVQFATALAAALQAWVEASNNPRSDLGG